MSDDPKKRARLTPRQRRFAAEYPVDLNAKEAAVRAGYTPGKAQAMAARLLRHPAIAAAMEPALAARKEETRVTADRVIEGYARIAFADIRHFLDWGSDGDVTLRPKESLSDWDAGAIADIEPPGSNGKAARLRLHDKKAALDALARHLGLFDQKARAVPSDLAIDGKDPREVLRERLLRLVKKGGN
jgi:phage terminase small subunit